MPINLEAALPAASAPVDFAPAVASGPRLWMPERVVFTPAALDEEHGQSILKRVEALGLPVERLKSNRVTGVRGEDERATYNRAKRTLAVVNAPASCTRLQPIPPSADWQFHLAEGCPAHCQYCYLAGSLSGPPVIRAFANLPMILGALPAYETKEHSTFEASCYTDPLGIEHLTGSLAAVIKYFGTRRKGSLRFVSKFSAVDSLLDLPHNGQTQARLSVNVPSISRRFEGGTSRVEERIAAARKMALPQKEGGGGYRIGFVVAPIMPVENWRSEYGALLDWISVAIDFDADVTFELITHRFTPGSKEVLLGWYPKTQLDLDEAGRVEKRNKFGGTKYVYPREQMREMRAWFEAAIAARMPRARVLYWT
jgi:spore photoproduct lyase